ncbi:hypothetical protein HD554DRAFT_2329320 [Boletus coccyginus]|nr:hypothetical protein HD554DRAFT_2329320 [Boletus coccyginus]
MSIIWSIKPPNDLWRSPGLLSPQGWTGRINSLARKVSQDFAALGAVNDHDGSQHITSQKNRGQTGYSRLPPDSPTNSTGPKCLQFTHAISSVHYEGGGLAAAVLSFNSLLFVAIGRDVQHLVFVVSNGQHSVPDIVSQQQGPTDHRERDEGADHQPRFAKMVWCARNHITVMSGNWPPVNIVPPQPQGHRDASQTPIAQLVPHRPRSRVNVQTARNNGFTLSELASDMKGQE